MAEPWLINFFACNREMQPFYSLFVVGGGEISGRVRALNLTVPLGSRSLVCVPYFMLERVVQILALMSWVSVSCQDSDTRAPRSVSLCECAVSSSCFVVLHAVFIGCMHSCYVRTFSFTILADGMIFPPLSGMLDPCQSSSNNWKLISVDTTWLHPKLNFFL